MPQDNTDSRHDDIKQALLTLKYYESSVRGLSTLMSSNILMMRECIQLKYWRIRRRGRFLYAHYYDFAWPVFIGALRFA